MLSSLELWFNISRFLKCVATDIKFDEDQIIMFHILCVVNDTLSTEDFLNIFHFSQKSQDNRGEEVRAQMIWFPPCWIYGSARF